MKKLLILLFVLTESYAQSFRFQAEVGEVAQTAYYRILLPPTVVGHLNANLTDMRLYDAQQKEIPYLLIRQSLTHKTQFTPYEIVRKTMTPHGATTLVLRNAVKSRINSLGLVIKNNNVPKTARLSGSNDAKTWYGIDDNFVLEPIHNRETTSEVRLLNFPLSDYEYYQLAINDSVTAPLNILSVGYYAMTAQQGTYSAIPGLTFNQRDSLRHSMLHLAFTDVVQVDKLTISVQSPAQYRRRAELCQLKTRKSRRGRWVQFYEPLRVFELSSTGDQTVYLPGLKASDLYLFIDNEDNPPLVMSSIKAYQADVYLLAELAKDKTCQLRFGNARVPAPTYDLVYFKDRIPGNLPIVRVSNLKATGPGQTTSLASTWFRNPWIIWPALGLVLGLLGFMSFRMLGEMGKG